MISSHPHSFPLIHACLVLVPVRTRGSRKPALGCKHQSASGCGGKHLALVFSSSLSYEKWNRNNRTREKQISVPHQAIFKPHSFYLEEHLQCEEFLGTVSVLADKVPLPEAAQSGYRSYQRILALL